jgi:hypothetical protein
LVADGGELDEVEEEVGDLWWGYGGEGEEGRGETNFRSIAHVAPPENETQPRERER